MWVKKRIFVVIVVVIKIKVVNLNIVRRGLDGNFLIVGFVF